MQLDVCLWSDGTTGWVADDEDDRIYAYNLETKEWTPDALPIE